MLPKAKSTKLTKCFFSTVYSEKDTPYGIYNDQIRAHGIVNSAGWFNSSGERLGKGDLSLKDMTTISKHIYPDDLFIVLNENDSFLELPQEFDYLDPGQNYVFGKALWVIGSGGVIIRIRDDISKTEDAEKDGVKYVRMSRKDFLRASKLGPQPPPQKAPGKPIPTPALKVQPQAAKGNPILTQQPGMLGMPPLPPPLANTFPKLPGLFPANPPLKAKPLLVKRGPTKKTTSP